MPRNREIGRTGSQFIQDRNLTGNQEPSAGKCHPSSQMRSRLLQSAERAAVRRATNHTASHRLQYSLESCTKDRQQIRRGLGNKIANSVVAQQSRIKTGLTSNQIKTLNSVPLGFCRRAITATCPATKTIRPSHGLRHETMRTVLIRQVSCGSR